MQGHILERSHTNVKYVKKDFHTNEAYKYIQKHIQVKNHTNVMCVIHSVQSRTLSCIRGHILERNHTNVMCVRKGFHKKETYKHIQMDIQVKNHTIVMCVMHSIQSRILDGMLGHIQERSTECVKLFSQNETHDASYRR